MTRSETLSALRARAAEIRQHGVTGLYLFGSVARDMDSPGSDVDLFVDPDPDRFDFVELIRLRDRLSSILDRPADVTTREGLHPLLRRAIEEAAIRVF
jgi:predicted nucleotidyltransferase